MKQPNAHEGVFKRFFHHFSDFFYRAVVLGFIGKILTSFSASETAFRRSYVGHVLEEGRGNGHVHRSLRRLVATALSRNPVLRALRALLFRLYATALRSIGLFLITAGGYITIVYWLADTIWDSRIVTASNLAMGIVMFTFGVLLMFSDMSLGYAVRKSILCRGVRALFGLTGDCLKDVSRNGKNDYVIAVPLGMAVGALSAWLGPIWLPIVVFLIALVLLIFTVPEAGVLFMLMLLPFAGLVPHSAAFAATAVLLPLAAYLGKLLRGNRALHIDVQDLPVLLLCFLFLLSGVSAAGGGAWQGALLFTLFAAGYLLVKNTVTTREWTVRCHIGFTVSATVSALFGILQFVYAAATSRGGEMSDLALTVKAGFPDHIAYSCFLMIAFPFAVALFLGAKRHYRMLAAVSCLLILGATVLTWVSAALFCELIAVLLFLLILAPRSFPYLLFGGGVGATVVAVLPSAWRRGIARALETPYPQGHTAFRAAIARMFFPRGQGLYSAWAGFRRFLFGLGYGGVESVYPAFSTGASAFLPENCNFWLYLLTDYGLFGVLLLAAFFFLLLQNCFATLLHRTEGGKSLTAIVGVSLTAGWVFFGFFHYTWHAPALPALFFAVCGYVAAVLKQEAVMRRRAVGDAEPQTDCYAEMDYSLYGGDTI